MRTGVETNNRVPFEFARRRFTHASYELQDTDRSIYERLLNALLALAPLNAEDLPRPSRLLYEQVQRLIGAELWSHEANSGTLAPAVRALLNHEVAVAVQLIFMAGDSLDRYCEARQADTENQSTVATTIIQQKDDSTSEEPTTRTFYLV